jgi:2-dehydro-3-deoxygluconokinase
MDFDVVVIGEVLVELSSTTPFEAGIPLTLGFSGDALNAAAASAAAGARTALLTRVADDELGHALLARVGALGVSTDLVHLVPGQHGAYFVHSDPHGERQFAYARGGSAASLLGPGDVAAAGLDRANVVVSSGITGALSPSAADAVRAAARVAARFVYDPNFRPRLTTAAQATALLRDVAPHAALVTPAFPGETGPLLGVADPAEAVRAVRAAGAAAVAVTRGAGGVLLDDGSAVHDLPAVPPPSLADQTGAGDCLVGMIAGRLALGDSLLEATRLGIAAASLSLAGQGGTGYVPTLEQVRAHALQEAP